MVASHRHDDIDEPEEMIAVGSEDAENFEFEPLAAMDDSHEADGENGPGRKRVKGVLADGDGGEGEKEGEAGDDLEVVAEGVHDHGCGNGEEKDKVNPLRNDDPHIGKEMHGPGDEKDERPASAKKGAGKYAVTVEALEVNAGSQDEETDQIGECNFCGIAQ